MYYGFENKKGQEEISQKESKNILLSFDSYYKAIITSLLGFGHFSPCLYYIAGFQRQMYDAKGSFGEGWC